MPPVANYGQATDLVNRQKQEFGNLLGQQQQTAQGLFNQYTDRVQAQPRLVDTLRSAQEQAGIGELQQGIKLFGSQASGVKGMIDRLNENTASRTQGTGANQAYLDRMRAVEGGGLNTQLSRLTTGLGEATNAYQVANANTGQLLAATQSDRDAALKPLELQINALSDRFAREITGYTVNSKNELDGLLTKLNAEQQLNQREWERVTALATQERSFQQQRQAVADEARSRASAFSSLQEGGGSGTQPQMQQAANALTSLFKTNNVGTVSNTIRAITDSANRGNTYDQMKLQLIKQYQANSPYANLINQAQNFRPLTVQSVRNPVLR